MLVSLAEGLWTVDHPEFSVGGLRLGTRSTVVRQRDGGLLLHSPGPLSPEDLDALRALGPVTAIVVANQLHHLFAAQAVAAFPQAQVFAAPGAKAKQPALANATALDSAVPSALAADFDMLKLEGAKGMDERVFFHHASSTLIGVDLAFNIQRATGFFRFAMWLNDANDKLCMTRLGKSQFLSDHRAAAASVDAMCDAWPFQRLIIAHGDVVETGANPALRAAYAFGRV